MRILREAVDFDPQNYTDINTLYRHKAINPVKLTRGLTYMYGRETNSFPLLTLTEGNGLVGTPTLLNDTQYTWGIMGRARNVSMCLGLKDSITKPGVNWSTFRVYFKDNLLIGQHGAMSPDGQYTVRIQGEPVQENPEKWLYTFVLVGGSATDYVTLDNLVAGKYWVMTASSVAASLSEGNRSNSRSPGIMTNQFGYQRYSHQISGNVDKITEFEFNVSRKDGTKSTTNLWLPQVMCDYMLKNKKLMETELWISKYNRDENGNITTKDEKTGEPIPKGAGVFEVLRSFGLYDTYSTLTRAKLDSIITTIFSNRSDDNPREIVIYTGMGGIREFDSALKDDASANSYFTPMGESEIKDSTGFLTYGNYFRHYRTIDGYMISVINTDFFNHGSLAEADRANGHMINGLPLSSYRLVFLDHSKVDTSTGTERNIQLVAEKGREYMSGIYRGMTPMPSAWQPLASKMSDTAINLATTKDVMSYEEFYSQGIAFKNPTTSFDLQRIA